MYVLYLSFLYRRCVYIVCDEVTRDENWKVDFDYLFFNCLYSKNGFGNVSCSFLKYTVFECRIQIFCFIGNFNRFASSIRFASIQLYENKIK